VAEILAALVASGPSTSWPYFLVEACREATNVTGVGMALIDEAGIGGIVAATGGAAEHMEDLQFILGEGPCVEASRSGQPVLCSDLAVDGAARWPAFASGAEAAGVAAAFTFPLRVGVIALGVLDLYRDSSGPLSGAEPREAVAFADAAVAVLLHLQERNGRDSSDGDSDGDRTPRTTAQPNESALLDLVDRRAVVHQAVGMLSVQLGLDLSDALLRLRAYARSRERPIADVAAEVVARRLRLDDSRDGTALGPGGPEPDGGPGRTIP
jgi:GAF domain-containing protein